ncbi:hypothetical protein LUZ61_006825 [Rhynchospora tenuis]|uniref:RING-type E3 ubiquitin transferase n=1 Tax=Rhynchospora tenuis TaxID=198213 RepID=A0AAD6EW15_9POAL|nr:hypothetical protein LUZ61_006825 [Rhynchospora tenuis]
MVNSNNTQDSQSALIPVHGQSGILALSLTILCPLLAVIFIFLFFKLLCHSHIMVPRYETSNHSSNTTMQKNQHDGIDAKEIHRISIELFEGETGSETQCSICLGGLADGDKVKVLPLCYHVFHPECIDMWLSSHSSCPLCRASLISRPNPTKVSLPSRIVVSLPSPTPSPSLHRYLSSKSGSNPTHPLPHLSPTEQSRTIAPLIRDLW